MPPSEAYRAQVRLLVEAIPFVAAETEFALKGGTAINLFVRDMPQLSVDIDLTFLPVAPRAESLAAIDAAMKRPAATLRARLRGVKVIEVMNAREQIVTRLTVQRPGAQIKIEVTPVLRGCVFAPELRRVMARVEDEFGFAETPLGVLRRPLCRQDRRGDHQHPRDLFDIRELLAHEGVSDELRQAFLVYLISHDRPIAEVIVPRRKDIAREFAQGFDGMTDEPVALADLLAAREELIAVMAGGMPDLHRRFLRGFKAGEPDWDLLGVPGAADLPAVRWKQMDLDKLSPEARGRLVAQLTETLNEV